MQYFDEFTNKCRKRLQMGEDKYGSVAHLNNNLISDILEELLDACNYLYLMYVRVKRIQENIDFMKYLDICRVIDLTDDPDAKILVPIMHKYQVCYRYNGREHHWCEKRNDE